MFRKGLKWYVGSELGGFEWPIFVGVDAFAYGKAGREYRRKVIGYVGGALCQFVVEEVFSGTFEGAMRLCGGAVMEVGY